MKKIISTLTIAVTVLATSGCAPFWHGSPRGGHGARLVLEQPFNSGELNQVVKHDNAQLVALSD
jgi:hypothetical protein